MGGLTRRQKVVLAVMAVADLVVVCMVFAVIWRSWQQVTAPPPVTPTATERVRGPLQPTWTPTVTPTPLPTIPPRPTNTPTLTPTPFPTLTPTPLPPTPTPGPLPIVNGDFDLLMPNRIPGWTWDAYVNYRPGDEYDPDNSYAEPFFMAADDPARQIHGMTLKVETMRWLKFRTWVHQTVTVTAGSVVYFRIKATAFSSLDRVQVKAGIDPTGAEDCYDARWGEMHAINQDDGVVTLKSPRVTVGEEGKVTLCFFAEPTYPHVNNAAFFDQAELILVSYPPPP